MHSSLPNILAIIHIFLANIYILLIHSRRSSFTTTNILPIIFSSLLGIQFKLSAETVNLVRLTETINGTSQWKIDWSLSGKEQINAWVKV